MSLLVFWPLFVFFGKMRGGEGCEFLRRSQRPGQPWDNAHRCKKKIRKKGKKKKKKEEKEKLFEYHEVNEPSYNIFGVQYNIVSFKNRPRRRSGFLRFIWVTVITGGKL